MKKVITIVTTAALTIFMNVSVFANVNYALLNEWSKQPEKIQYALARDGTTINVVPALPVTYMNETWAVTNTYCYPGTKYILKTDVLLLPDHEDCLTHEVGHCVSHQDRTAFFWVENPYWINIFMQEARRQTIYPQGWDNAYEYFACCYEEYLRFPKYMQKLQPSSYNYMKVVFSYQ